MTQSTILMDMLLSNNNPLILIIAATLTVGLDKKAFHSALVNWLASSTLAIYLITDSGGLRNYIMPWLLDNVMATPLLGYSMMVIVCLACLMIDKVRTVFVTPLNKGIEKVFQYSKERIKCI